MPEVRAFVDVDASRQQVWDALTDWERQGDWMLGTSVAVVNGDGRSVDSVLSARTQVGPLAFVDTMRISEWDPCRRCAVDHTGELVRGTGVFEVRGLADGRVRLIWTELLDLPFAAAGAVGWLAVGPIAHVGLQLSLRRFAQWLGTR